MDLPKSGDRAQINRYQSVFSFPKMISAGFPPFFTDRGRGGWMRRRGRAGTGTDAAFFPGCRGKKIHVGALERGFLSFRLSLRSDEELEFSLPLASLRGRRGKR